MSEPYTLIIICQWCGLEMGQKVTTDEHQDGNITSGICVECFDAEIKRAKEFKKGMR